MREFYMRVFTYLEYSICRSILSFGLLKFSEISNSRKRVLFNIIKHHNLKPYYAYETRFNHNWIIAFHLLR